jgi:phage terminase large subunit
LQIWGVNDDRMYRIAEIYRTGQNQDWWAEHVVKYHEKYNLQALVCDPSEPEYIKVFNDRLGHARGRNGNRIARKARNAIRTGIDMVRWGLSKVDNGPRIYIIRDSLVGRDRDRVEKKKPYCLEDEMASYIWTRSRDGKPVKERPDPTCSDHAIDSLRYAAMFMWNRDMATEDNDWDYPENSFGRLLSHKEVKGAPHVV